MRLWFHQWLVGVRRRPLAWVILAATLTLLTIYNVVLGLRLMPLEWSPTPNDSRSEWNEGLHLPPPPFNVTAASLLPLHLDLHAGRYDNRRAYRIHDFALVGGQWSHVSGGKVCLATQTSLDRLASLVEVARAWQGPVSVALFAPDVEFLLALRYLRFLRGCYAAVRDNVSVHLVYPAVWPPAAAAPPDLELVNLTCGQPVRGLQKLLQLRPLAMIQWREKMMYPQNHLRNVARKACHSDYVFLTDIDIVPRQGLAVDLAAFLRRPDLCDRCAYVVPTYEIVENLPLPRNKTELLQLVKKKRAQPFHQTVFIHNQFATNNSRWENLPEEDTMAAAYRVTNYEFFYEPFYVAKDSVPPHDERFIGYGFTRNTQVYEMVLAGYHLWVLNNAFALHRGMGSRKVRPVWREKQNSANLRLLKGFKREVTARYSQDHPHQKRSH